MGGSGIAIYVGYGILGILVFVSGILGLKVWAMRRRRGVAPAPDTYSRREWNRYASMLQGMENPSPIARRMQRLLQQRGGITVEELDVVAPVKRFGQENSGGDTSASGSTSLGVNEDIDKSEAAVAADSTENRASTDENKDAGPINNVDEDKDTTCAICLDEMQLGEKTRQLPCKHEYHSRCVEEWVTKVSRCPICSKEPMDTELRNRDDPRLMRTNLSYARERRRRTRTESGHYELTPITFAAVSNGQSMNDSVEEVPEAPLPPPVAMQPQSRAVSA